MNHLIDYDVIDGQAWCTTATIPQPMVDNPARARSVMVIANTMEKSAFQNKRLKLEDEEAQCV